MSGIVGILNADAAPVDRRLLGAMTASLRFRGPDAERVWTDGPVGFGHTLLAATDEATEERQPSTLDGSVWIVADARIDGREDLRRKLGAVRPADTRDATDDHLILHAYHAWGEKCVEHLIGDFAFAIWDGPSRRLFCARDHFGVKPFFYARTEGTFVFSNALDAVRRHPAVRGDIDDLSIADFLLFNRNLRSEATAFAGVNRLPAGHVLVSTPDTLTVRRYWKPVDGRPLADLRYRRGEDYVDHFRQVFGEAVRDRLRTRRVAVSLSGGLDSPFVAATAKAELQRLDGPFTLTGHTMVYDHLIADEERKYTSIAADAIGIPVRFLTADNYQPFDASMAQCPVPEPMDVSYRAMYLDFWRAMAFDARVALTGSDADGLLNELIHERFQVMARDGHLAALARDAAAYVKAFGRRPPVGFGSLFRKARLRVPALPVWLDHDLVRRLDLETRWREFWASRRALRGLRPRAMHTMPVWSRVFEGLDPQVTRQPLEFRHPFADKRVTDYLLAIPAVPWCTQKQLLRLASEGVLPETIRSRAKSPLRESPMVAHLRQARSGGIEDLRPVPELSRYLDMRNAPCIAGVSVTDAVHENIRPFVLNGWLSSVTGAAHEEGVEIQPCA